MHVFLGYTPTDGPVSNEFGWQGRDSCVLERPEVDL